MKKIGKISINSEKVIKNEELVNLRGGYYGAPWCCETEGRTPEVTLCWDDEQLLIDFCLVWEGFGYGCRCYNAEWA